jgi:hypothetical protein
MKWIRCLSVALLALFVSSAASAAVRREGSWPDADKPISLDLDGVGRAQAVRKVAQAAGWGIGFERSVLADAGSDAIDLHVKDQPAAKVLEIVLSDGDYVAKRDGTLVTLTRTPTAEGSADAAPAAPAAIPSPAHGAASHDTGTAEPPASADRGARHERGDDRVVTGGHLTIKKGEHVHDVSVLGGSVDIYGEVSGDVSVMGGSVHIHDGAEVHGDAHAVGGALSIDDGAKVTGDVGVVAGSLKRGKNAQIGGAVVRGAGSSEDDDDDDESDGPRVTITDDAGHKKSHRFQVPPLARTVRDIGSAITRAAFLFIFGAIVLALAGKRMEDLKVEIAARPMRAFALGLLGILGGALMLVVLCVTIIGIPIAVIAALAGTVAAYVGLAAALTTVGHALLRHRTPNPYVHLALGCALWLVAGALPFGVGWMLRAAAVLVGVGVMVATRAAGIFPKRNRPEFG